MDKFVDIDLFVTLIKLIGLYVQSPIIFERGKKIMSNALAVSFGNNFRLENLCRAIFNQPQNKKGFYFHQYDKNVSEPIGL